MKTALGSGLGKYRDFGLLLMRLGLGGMFIVVHGYPKMIGGPPLWEKIGGAVGSVGIHGYPVYWGFMAAFSELVGGVLLVLGLFTRPALALMLCTMVVAVASQLGHGLGGASHPIEVGVALLGLLFLGPGRHSFDRE